jgi:hypothetical protein
MFDKIVGDVQPTNGGGFNVSNGNGWLNVLWMYWLNVHGFIIL